MTTYQNWCTLTVLLTLCQNLFADSTSSIYKQTVRSGVQFVKKNEGCHRTVAFSGYLGLGPAPINTLETIITSLPPASRCKMTAILLASCFFADFRLT